MHESVLFYSKTERIGLRHFSEFAEASIVIEETLKISNDILTARKKSDNIKTIRQIQF